MTSGRLWAALMMVTVVLLGLLISLCHANIEMDEPTGILSLAVRNFLSSQSSNNGLLLLFSAQQCNFLYRVDFQLYVIYCI
jgi:hypothetical protein